VFKKVVQTIKGTSEVMLAQHIYKGE